jgi:hypothetical protein
MAAAAASSQSRRIDATPRENPEFTRASSLVAAVDRSKCENKDTKKLG